MTCAMAALQSELQHGLSLNADLQTQNAALQTELVTYFARLFSHHLFLNSHFECDWFLTILFLFLFLFLFLLLLFIYFHFLLRFSVEFLFLHRFT